MKYAIIGTGKTGQSVIDLLPSDDIIAVCNSRNPVTKDKVKGADAGIVFVPGKAMGDLLPVLLDLDLPLVIGTTGFDWPQDLDQKLKAKKRVWILSSNYSIGVNTHRYYATRIAKSMRALEPSATKIDIAETHHVHKLDAPSGTAITLAHYLDVPSEEIAAFREGDVKGIHTVTYNWPRDRISLTHEALDRKAFGAGAILAAQHSVKMQPGLHKFETLADTLIENALKG